MEELSTKAQRKAIEMERAQVELDEARAKMELARLELDRENRMHRDLYDYAPRERGRFVMSGVIDGRSCQKLLSDVDRYAYLNEGKPLQIVFETPGGSVLPGLGLYDSLRAIAQDGHHVTTVVRGYAASLGAILLQAGDLRLVGPESMFMIHEVSSMTMGKMSEMEDDLNFTKMLNTKLFDIIARRTDGKWTGAKILTKVKKSDWWLTSEETVSNGFADRIG